MDDLAARKKALRKEIKERAANLSEEYCKKADGLINLKVMELPQYKGAETVFCFVGAFSEPNTIPIIAQSLFSGKRVGVPKCLDDHTMKIYEIREISDLEQGMYGILEPKDTCPEIDKNEIDFSLIPCVTCDMEGNRLGHGKGYYDRFLEGTKFFTCMICRSKLISENIPVSEHDIKLNLVITDEA